MIKRRPWIKKGCLDQFPSCRVQKCLLNYQIKGFIIIPTTPSMFFSFQPQTVVYQPATITYVPLDLVYFVPNCQNFDQEIHTETNLAQKDAIPRAGRPRKARKPQQTKLRKMGFKSTEKVESALPKSQQQASEATKTQPKTKKPLQNAQRNIMPNIVHQIFCFIQKKKRSGHVVKHYLESQNLSQDQKFEIDHFYLYQKLIRDKTNNYINMKGLRELNRFHEQSFQVYSQQEQIKFIRMNRILLKYFLEHEFDAIVLTSSRMKAETRPWHFQMKRKILDSLHTTLALI